MWYIQMPNGTLFKSPNTITSTNAIRNEIQSAGIRSILSRYTSNQIPTSVTGRSLGQYRRRLSKHFLPKSKPKTGKRKRPNGPTAASKKTKKTNNTPEYLREAMNELGIVYEPKPSSNIFRQINKKNTVTNGTGTGTNGVYLENIHYNGVNYALVKPNTPIGYAEYLLIPIQRIKLKKKAESEEKMQRFLDMAEQALKVRHRHA